MALLTRASALQHIREASRGSLPDLEKVLEGIVMGDLAGGNQALTATAAVTPGVATLEVNHATVVVAATIADAKNHAGVFNVKNTSGSGTAAHTVTLTAGTWDGTNTVATLNAPAESLLVWFDGAGNGRVLVNTGAVALS